MTNTSKHALLEAAAKVLAWELHAAASYGRTRAYVNVERFDHELLSTVAKWKAIRNNLNHQQPERSKKNGNTGN